MCKRERSGRTPAECVSLRSDANGWGRGGVKTRPRGGLQGFGAFRAGVRRRTFRWKKQRWREGLRGAVLRAGPPPALPLLRAICLPQSWGENWGPQAPGVRTWVGSGSLAPNQGGNEQNQLRVFLSAGLQELLHVPNLSKPPKLSQTHF